MVGAFCWQLFKAETYAASWLRTTLETCGSISRLCVVQQFAKILFGCFRVLVGSFASPSG